MDNNFEVFLMEEAEEFIKSLDKKIQEKVVYNIQKAKKVNDPKLFNKLNKYIWEFRTEYQNRLVRLFAFWDPNINAYVVCTHGIVKKTQKTPKKELDKADRIRNQYLEESKNK